MTATARTRRRRVLVIHFATTNDGNGNPRRYFEIIDPRTGALLDIIDEGYMGRAAWSRVWPNATEAGYHHTTPAEYREAMRMARRRGLTG